MKDNLSFKNIFKRETKLASYIVICLTIVVLSLSYAMFFKVEGNSKNQVVEAGDLVFTYENTSQTITSEGNRECFMPMSADETSIYLGTCDYRLSVQNTGSLKGAYTLRLVANEENTIEANKIKVIVRKQEGEVFQIVSGYENGKTVSELTDGIIIEDEEMETNSTVVFSISLIIDENVATEEDTSKVLSYKIEGTGLVHESQEITTKDVVDEIVANEDKTGACPIVDENGIINIANIENTNGYICSAPDNYGTSYYFRGNVNNNWVKFAGYYWRIIRINGDGSIRMIYAGDASIIDALPNKSEVLKNGYDDSVTHYTQIDVSAYNSLYKDNAYVGYMYGTIDANTHAETHANLNDSIIKGVIDSWYESHLKNTKYEKYISDTLFCNDRSFDYNNTGTGAGTSVTYYRWYRLKSNVFLTCSQQNDRFTVNDTEIGNGSLTYPVGLITTDEVALAGGYDVANRNYYMFTGNDYWTMSPYAFYNSSAFVRGVHSDGNAGVNSNVNPEYGVRPVLNLKSGSLIKGTGTADDPYQVS